MKLHGKISMNGRTYAKGAEVPWYKVYPFFLIHMLAFGISGFAMAYATQSPPVPMLYLHGGFALLIYTVFYLTIFGRDEVKWMFINAGLGFLGIVGQLDWLLSWFGKGIRDYPIQVHVIPFLYFVFYTFLIRQAVLDITRTREDDIKKKHAEYGYVAVSLVVYLILFFL